MAKILVVDDEPVYLQHLCLILTADGHEVDTAETGEGAVKAGRRSNPQVLITDWKLKDGLSGLEVAKALQATNPTLATIIMTGYPVAQMGPEAEGVKGMQILEKPFGARVVREMIREATGGAAEEAAEE